MERKLKKGVVSISFKMPLAGYMNLRIFVVLSVIILLASISVSYTHLMAVELAKLQRIIAYYFQVDEETLTELHNFCQREVKSMNGTLSLEDMIK